MTLLTGSTYLPVYKNLPFCKVSMKLHFLSMHDKHRDQNLSGMDRCLVKSKISPTPDWSLWLHSASKKQLL